VPETVGVIQLEYGQYTQDFRECSGYHVDISGEEPTLVFSYPDPNQPEKPQVFQLPLSEQIQEHSQRLADLELALAELFAGGA